MNSIDHSTLNTSKYEYYPVPGSRICSYSLVFARIKKKEKSQAGNADANANAIANVNVNANAGNANVNE